MWSRDLDEPLVVLDPEVEIDADALAGVPAVFVASAGDAADVVVAGDDELAEVRAAVDAHPEAAIVLAVLLRGGSSRSIAEGLVAESAAYALLQAGADHRRWLADKAPPRAPGGEGARPVLVARDADVLSVTLNRPEVRNAYSAGMRDALVEALDVAAADTGVLVELRGSGPSFCSGGDLDEFGTAADPAVAHRIRLARSAGRSIAAVADRVTAHVHGACVGAGVELPAFAGRVVADPSATFWLPELAMGLVPGAGGTVSIPRRIGRQRTALLALTGRRLDAATALDWGLVDEIATTAPPDHG
jgi:enoyl-CoA hydratase/carnithine racemase